MRLEDILGKGDQCVDFLQTITPNPSQGTGARGQDSADAPVS